MRARRHLARLLIAGVLATASLTVLTGCGLPPALSKVELDAAKLPKKHPQMTAEQIKAGCRSCHREQEAVR